MDARQRLILPCALALVVWTSCAVVEEAETVSLYGTLYVGPEIGEPPEILTGGHLDAYDDLGELLAEGSEPWPEDSPGYYRIRDLPPESHVNVVAWAEDGTQVPTVHGAWLPPSSLFTYDGELFILGYDWLAYRLKLVTKAGLGRSADEVIAPLDPESGGFVFGSLADPDLHEGLRVFVRPVDHKPVEAVYLDGFGIARPDLLATGPAGGFAVFDLPAGPADAQLVAPGDVVLGSFPVLIVEDGCTVLFEMELVP